MWISQWQLGQKNLYSIGSFTDIFVDQKCDRESICSEYIDQNKKDYTLAPALEYLGPTKHSTVNLSTVYAILSKGLETAVQYW